MYRAKRHPKSVVSFFPVGSGCGFATPGPPGLLQTKKLPAPQVDELSWSGGPFEIENPGIRSETIKCAISLIIVFFENPLLFELQEAVTFPTAHGRAGPTPRCSSRQARHAPLPAGPTGAGTPPEGQDARKPASALSFSADRKR